MPPPTTALTFPAIAPTKRSLIPGDYPTREYRSMNGSRINRLFGNRPFGVELTLTFENILDFDAVRILAFWDTTYGRTYSFDLSSEILAGMNTQLAEYTKAGTYYKWWFAEKPAVDADQPNVKTVSIKLIGDVDYKYSAVEVIPPALINYIPSPALTSPENNRYAYYASFIRPAGSLDFREIQYTYPVPELFRTYTLQPGDSIAAGGVGGTTYLRIATGGGYYFPAPNGVPGVNNDGFTTDIYLRPRNPGRTMYLWDYYSANNGSGIFHSVSLLADNKINVTCQPFGPLLTYTTTVAIANNTNTWTHLAVHVNLRTGELVVWVNGDIKLSVPVTTTNFTGSSDHQEYFLRDQAGSNTYIGDVAHYRVRYGNFWNSANFTPQVPPYEGHSIRADFP